jgi:predicted permease
MIAVAGGGYLLSRLYDISEDTLVRAVTDFFMPLLVFYALYTSDINLLDTLKVSGAVSLVLFILLTLVFFYCRLFRLDLKAVAPPIIFMNSGFLGIPLMKLWGGLGAMNLIVIYDQIQTFYIFTLGLILITGGLTFSGLLEMVKSPLLWSIIGGFVFKYAGIAVPDAILRFFHFGGSVAPALATFVLGCSLAKRKVRIEPHVVGGIFMRIGFGFMAGWLAVYIFDIQGVAAMVILTASSLPSAVFSVVLPLRYGVDASYAGSVVVVSTLLSLLTIPLVFMLGHVLIESAPFK